MDPINPNITDVHDAVTRRSPSELDGTAHHLRPHRIQMHVAHELEEVRARLAENAVVAVLEKVPDSPVAEVERFRTNEPMSRFGRSVLTIPGEPRADLSSST